MFFDPDYEVENVGVIDNATIEDYSFEEEDFCPTGTKCLNADQCSNEGKEVVKSRLHILLNIMYFVP